MNQKFSPTAAQIGAAQNLFIAMAFHEMVKPEFEKMESEILAAGEYHYDEKYYTGKWAERKLPFPPDKIIRNPAHIHHMAGLQLLDKEGYAETDCARYYSELSRRAQNKGFLDAENAAAVASNQVVKMENAFIFATQPIHGLVPEDIYGENRDKLIDLLLKLFAGLVNDSQLAAKQKKYFNERMATKVVA